MDQVEKIGFSHYRIHTSIEIDATPEQVWAVLVDTKAYENWAAFMVAIGGEIEDGNTITVDFQLNPARPKRVTIDHRIEVTAGQEFFWAEKGPGGICDDHHFRIEATSDGRTRFVQSDEIKKGLTWLMGWKLSAIYRDGYQAFNQALKQEAERRAQAS